MQLNELPIVKKYTGKTVSHISFLIVLPTVFIALVSWFSINTAANNLQKNIELKNQLDLINLSLVSNAEAVENSFQKIDKEFISLLQQNQYMMYSSDFTVVVELFESMNVVRSGLQEMYGELFAINAQVDQAMASVESLTQEQKNYRLYLENLERQLNALGRQGYKFGWQFDQLVTTTADTVNIARTGEYEKSLENYLTRGRLDAESILATKEQLFVVLNGMSEAVGKSNHIIAGSSSSSIASSIDAFMSSSISGVFVSVGVIFLLGMGYLYFSIVKPLSSLTDSVQLMSQGQASMPLSENMRNDHFGELSRSLCVLLHRRSKIEQEYARLADENERMKLALVAANVVPSLSVDEQAADKQTEDESEFIPEAYLTDSRAKTFHQSRYI